MPTPHPTPKPVNTCSTFTLKGFSIRSAGGGSLRSRGLDIDDERRTPATGGRRRGGSPGRGAGPAAWVRPSGTGSGAAASGRPGWGWSAGKREPGAAERGWTAGAGRWGRSAARRGGAGWPGRTGGNAARVGHRGRPNGAPAIRTGSVAESRLAQERVRERKGRDFFFTQSNHTCWAGLGMPDHTRAAHLLRN